MMKGSNSLESRIEAMLAPKVASLGYELLSLEYQVKSAIGGPVLRVFVENPSGQPISFEDCATVDRGLDELIGTPDFETVLASGFTLEVSSPGIDRPLKKAADFARYTGKRANLKTIRPLTLEEMGNETYFEHHQKQKNFSGIIRGFAEGSVELETDGERFRIPFEQVTKANLDIASQLSGDGSEE